MEKLRNLLRDGDNPVETIANAVTQMVTTVLGSAQQNGIDLPASGVARATGELVSDLAKTLPRLAGIAPLSTEHAKGIFIRSMEGLGQTLQSMQQQEQGAEGSGNAMPPEGGQGMQDGAMPPQRPMPGGQRRPGLMGRRTAPM